MEENKCHHEVFRAFFHKGHVHFTPFSPSIMPISCYLPQMPHCATVLSNEQHSIFEKGLGDEKGNEK